MIILGIETSCRTGSVALCRDDRPVASHVFPEGIRQARDILPAVDRVVTEAGLARTAIDAVTVSHGPGSFTGLRIGVTCAKTLAYALGWRIVGVPSLEVQVQNVACTPGACACPVLDARRGHVYGTVFRGVDHEWRSTTGVLIVEPQELAEAIPEGATVFGTGVEAYPDVFASGRFEVGDPSLGIGRAEKAAEVGRKLLLAGRESDPMTLVPQYYRPTEAEERLGSK